MTRSRHRNVHSVQSAIDQLSYPTFNLNTSGGTSSLSGGALPWWATLPPALGNSSTTPAPGPASSLYGTTPESHRSPGYMGAGYSDLDNGVGGSPTGEHGDGYELNSRQAARLGGQLGSLFGLPSQVGSALVNWYSQRTGANNPFGPTGGGSFTPGVTVTDNDTNQEPQYRYQGYGSDPLGGGFGHNYYGPARGDTSGDYGENAMNEFGQSARDWWNSRMPGQNVSNTGIGGFGTGWHGGDVGDSRNNGGGGGGASLIFAGSASPWDWGGGYSY